MSEKIEFQITVTKDELLSALGSATEEAKKTEKAVYRISDAFSDAGSEISKIRSSFIGNLGANAVTGAFNLLRGALGETITQAREYSRAIAEVNSILPKTTKLTDDQTKALIALSSQYGKAPQEQAKALYEIISAGVEDVNVAFKILRQSNEAATAGLTSVNTTAKTLTATFNAFAQQGTTVNQITDSLFQAVKDGQVTFEELSGTLGRVSPIAASVGVSISEVAGTVAFLTKSGLQTDQAVTGLRTTLSAIIKPTKEATDEANRLGIAFNVAAIQKAGGFANFLNQVRIATNGSSTSIARLFGDVNAINTVISIANGNFADFTKTLESNKNSIGATASAAKELKDSFDFRVGQAEQSIKNLATSFSVFLLPVLQSTLTGFRALTGIGQVNLILDENQKKINALGKEYNNLRDQLNRYNLGFTYQIKNAQEATAVEDRLNQILKERQAIRASQIAQDKEAKTTGVTTAPVVDPAAEAEAVRLRLETFQKLAIARTEFAAFEAQRNFDAQALAGEANQVEFESLLAFEQQKIDAKFAKEVELTKLIQDEKAKRNALDAIAKQKELALENKRVVELNKLSKSRSDEEIRQLSIRNNYIQAAANLGASLFKQGSKEAFVIQKAAALAGVAIDDAKARSAAVAVSAALPPGVSQAYLAKQFSLITSTTALAASSIAASALKGFANGGIVGASAGPDDQLATVRSGEMILNAEQQEKLFSAINSGTLGGGDIVVQIDSREIARAVRNQFTNGYKFV